jgi:hypothetical protein
MLEMETPPSTLRYFWEEGGLYGPFDIQQNLESLIEKIYRKDETRQFAWLDILRANIYMNLEELGEATKYAKIALVACQDIHSITNIAIIADIYVRLLASSHKASSDVQELGDILETSPATT